MFEFSSGNSSPGTGLTSLSADDLGIAYPQSGVIKVEGGAGISTRVAAGKIIIDLDGGVSFGVASVIAGAGLTGGGTGTPTLNVGSGPGVLVTADAVGLITPGSVSATSLNNENGGHTHAVIASSDPGTNGMLLKSDGTGKLRLPFVTVSDTLRLENGDLISTDPLNIIAPSVSIGASVTVNGDILPATNYGGNIGSPTHKWLTAHIAELYLETLVAQDVLATVGGRILVGPTTTLIYPILASTGDSIVITTKHNNFAVGDTGYMEKDLTVEFFKVTAGPVAVSGGYEYTVSRNQDLSGKNAWEAGDALFNTGTIGDGFIDLYAIQGVKSGYGPTIAFNKRTAATYNGWVNIAGLGNLRGLYDYAAGIDRFGIVAGDPTKTWFAVDETNGMRIMNASSEKLRAEPDGDIVLSGMIRSANDGFILSNDNGLELQQGTQNWSKIRWFRTGAEIGGITGTGATNADVNTIEVSASDDGVTTGGKVRLLATRTNGGNSTSYLDLIDTDADGSIIRAQSSTFLHTSQGGVELFKQDGFGTTTLKNSGNNVTMSLTDGGTLTAAAFDTNGTLHAGQAVTLTDAANAAYQLNLGSSAQNYGGSSVFNMMMNSSGTSSIGFHHSNNSIGSLRFNNKVFSMICHDGSNVTSFDVYGGANKNGGGSWGVLSDVRSKEQESIKPYKRGLDFLSSFNVVEFKYKQDYDDTGKTYVGVVAQEAQQVAPHMVNPTKRHKRGNESQEDMLTFDGSELTWALINAVKELARELEQVKGQVNDSRSNQRAGGSV